MNLAIDEIKIQAKKLLKAYKNNQPLTKRAQLFINKIPAELSEDLKLKHCLAYMAQQLGLEDWRHAQSILSGKTEINNDSALNMGTFFYNSACGAYINQWFANYDDAKQALNNNIETKWLLPYKNQFIVVNKEYLISLKVTDKNIASLSAIQNDLYQGYNTTIWDEFTYQVIKNR